MQQVRLVLLWFATWKNNGPNYAPEWVKLDNARFPRLIDAKGKRAEFPVAACRGDAGGRQARLRRADAASARGRCAAHRDHGAGAERARYLWQRARLRAGGAEAVRRPRARRRWSRRAACSPATGTRSFGKDADEFFHAWAVAHFIGEVAAAGKKEYALPMYVNASLRDPFHPGPPGGYASGGPTDNVISIYQAAAPGHRHRRARYLPQGIAQGRARHRVVQGRRAACWCRRSATTRCSRATSTTCSAPRPWASCPSASITPATPTTRWARGTSTRPSRLSRRPYRLLAPMAREWARLGFEKHVWGAGEPDDHGPRKLELGRWTATLAFNEWQFGHEAMVSDRARRIPIGFRILRVAPC